MTRTLEPPAPYHRMRNESKRDANERYSVRSMRWADANRVVVVCGVILVGWFPPDTPMDDVLEALAEPTAWPRWEPDHEDLSVWHAGRMLALVSRGPAGDLVVRRFDRA